MAASGQGFALPRRLTPTRWRGENPLVKQSPNEAGAVVVSDLLFGSAGPASQDLAPGLYANTQAFYAPTVFAGAVTLSPGLFSGAQTFYAPTVSQAGAGPQTLTPGLFTNSQAFYAPTVSGGAVSLAPARFDNAQAFYAPTVSRGAVALTAARFNNTSVFYSPSVYDPATIVPSSIRFDVTTGRLVKIINGSVAISF